MNIKMLNFIVILLLSVNAYSEDFKWARAKFDVKEPAQELWYVDMETEDKELLKQIENYTTIKTDKKVYTVSLDDLNDMVKYPIIYMIASRPPVLSEKEIANLKEYMSRGGLIFASDHHEGGDASKPVAGAMGTQDEFYRGMKTLLEDKIFPGKKCEVIPEGHEIFHSHFDMEFGFPHLFGPKNPLLGMKDDKGRYMAIMTSSGIQGGWSTADQGVSKFNRVLAVKMAINLIVYSMTH